MERLRDILRRSTNKFRTVLTAVFGEKIVFMLMDNYPITSIIGPYAALSTQLFLMFLGVAMLPLQFIYRYGVMIQKPFTNCQMFLMFCGSLMLGGLHGGLSPFTFRPRNEYYDEKLREAMDVGTNFTLPFYVVGDVSKFGIMSLHFINIFVIMAISYSIIITMVYLSKRSVTLVCSDQLSKQTRTVQKQVTKIIYLQALYPVLFVAIPCSIFPIIAVKGWQVPYFAEVAMSLMHTPPLVNSVLVIMCVPSYRRSVMRPFRTNSARETSTIG
uniref:7TM_GPCR_Srx domain-containing protein n=1 Tax=Bursaphelenchus xylophilus TaxID=6326 RepID=A0A1I7RXR7_BURXY